MTTPDSRHLQDFWIGEQTLLDLLFSLEGVWFRLEPLGVPADARVVGVWHDWPRRCFCLRVEHPSFHPVAEGQEVPHGAALIVEVKTEEPAAETVFMPTRYHP